MTNSQRLAKKLRLLHNGHQTRKYYHTGLGYNTRLDEIQAAILRVKLRHLNELIKKRQAVAAYYNKHITAHHIIKPIVQPNVRHVYHLYVIRTAKRDQLQKRLAQHDILTQVHYPWPLHRLPAFAALNTQNLPVAEQAAREVLSLPMYPGLTDRALKKIVQVINS